MKAQQLEVTWLDARESVSLAELSRACALSADELDELVGYGALVPLAAPAQAEQEHVFSAACVASLRTAGKLRLDYDLDLFTVAMLLDYLGRIEQLEQQLRSLQAQLPRPGL